MLDIHRDTEDRDRILNIADTIRTTIEHYSGWGLEETVLGLVQAITELAGDDFELLDNAANLLADGGLTSI
jgi:hypothetical protein